MHTAHLETVRTSVSVATIRCHSLAVPFPGGIPSWLFHGEAGTLPRYLSHEAFNISEPPPLWIADACENIISATSFAGGKKAHLWVHLDIIALLSEYW